jgi:putative DNA primase/helicase
VSYPLLSGAPCPEWLAFLERAFPGDPDAHVLIEEMLGLSMTEDLSFQKGILLIGEPRSGKGTILKVLEGLIGSAAYGTADLDTWLKGENSQQGLIGKRAIAFPDVRLQPAKWYGMTYDAGGLDHKSTARLLKITSGDTVDVGRKYQSAWEGALPGKVWMASNKVPNFNDATLPTRFVKLWFGQSYLDHEDIGLADKLLAELPGIAARCIAAYARLRERKRFVQPSSSDHLEAEIRKRSDAFTQWVEETFVADPAGEVRIGAAFSNFERWCTQHGHGQLLKSITLKNIRNYLHKVPGFKHVTTFRPDGSPVRYWAGIRFRKANEADDVLD